MGCSGRGPDIDDYHIDSTTEYVHNEVASDYNAAFVGACGGLYYFYGEGHQPIPNFLILKREQMIITVSPVERENESSSQIVIRLHNESSQPPHYETGMMARYSLTSVR